MTENFRSFELSPDVFAKIKKALLLEIRSYSNYGTRSLLEHNTLNKAIEVLVLQAAERIGVDRTEEIIRVVGEFMFAELGQKNIKKKASFGTPKSGQAGRYPPL
jgi:hypothetical protein